VDMDCNTEVKSISLYPFINMDTTVPFLLLIYIN